VLTLSALTGEGLDDLLAVLDKTLRDASHKSQLSLTFAQGKQRAWLFAQELVETDTQSDTGFDITVTWTAKQEKQFNDL
jgi:GTP-binding protein HflX